MQSDHPFTSCSAAIRPPDGWKEPMKNKFYIFAFVLDDFYAPAARLLITKSSVSFPPLCLAGTATMMTTAAATTATAVHRASKPKAVSQLDRPIGSTALRSGLLC